MKTKVQRWGNSLALRIPKSLAVEAQLEQDSLVDVSIIDGKIVVAPVLEPEWTLEQLMAGVTDENLHGEFDMGPAVGKEVW